MSWLFSQALVEASLGASSSDGEPCAPLSVMPTPHKFWRNDKTMECSTLSRFGLTCAVLTDDRGAALLTSFLEASRARTSVSPAAEQGSREPGRVSGLNLHGSLARFDPASSSWKTPQVSLIEDLDESLETWPTWGSMRNGVCWGRTTPGLPTSENGSGFWPTPVADGDRTTNYAQGGTSLGFAARNFPTPTATNTKANHMRSGGRPPRSYWATPTATEHKGCGPNSKQIKLVRQVRENKFPTPCACDFRSANKKPYSQRGGGKKGEQLVNYIAHFPTPRAGSKSGGGAGLDGGSGARKAMVERFGEEEAKALGSGGQLNPPWVEWLMGWPIGWTDLKPLETARSRRWPHSHSEPSCAA